MHIGIASLRSTVDRADTNCCQAGRSWDTNIFAFTARFLERSAFDGRGEQKVLLIVTAWSYKILLADSGVVPIGLHP